MAIDEKKLAGVVRTRYTHLRDQQVPIFDDVELYKQLYRCAITEDESYPWDYQLVDPQVFPIMRAHLARLNPSQAKILLYGKNSDIRQANQDVVNWEMNEILLTQVFYRLMFSGLIAGHGYLKSGWKYEPAVTVKSDTRNVNMKDKVNRADLANVRFQDLFIPNRNITELQEQPYLIEHLSMKFGDMLDDNKLEKKWKPEYLEKIKKRKMFTHQIDYGVDLPQDSDLDEDIILRSQYVSMLCLHTKSDVFFVPQDGEDWILNTNTDNPYWHGHYPYLDFAPFPEDDEFFSMGIVQPIADLQVALTSSLNQLLTNARKAGNPMWITGSDASQTPDHVYVNRPDGIIRVVGDPNQVRQVQFQDKSDSLMQVRGNLQTSLERTTGISSLYTSGVADQGQVNKTARGAEVISQNIDQNLQLLISLFGAQILKQAGEHFLELNAQYITEEQTVEITGKRGQVEFIQVAPDQISANFKVKVSPERFLKQSPAVRQSSLLNLYGTLKGSKHLNELEMERMIVDSYPEAEDADHLLIDPEDTANEAIRLMMKGIEPPKVTYTDDVTSIMTLIQKHMLEMPGMEPKILELFANYIKDLKLMDQAKNNNLVVQPEKPAQPLPTDPQALAQSMNVQPAQNPTLGLSVPMTQQQLGM